MTSSLVTRELKIERENLSKNNKKNIIEGGRRLELQKYLINNIFTAK